MLHGKSSPPIWSAPKCKKRYVAVARVPVARLEFLETLAR